MENAVTSRVRPHAETAVLAAALAAFGLVLFRTAWISDDAYITFRTVQNFLHGYGPRWNVAERVQAYTHPLWMLVLSAAGLLSREPYFTALAVSLGASLAAVGLAMFGLARTTWQAVTFLAIVASSRAFVDFSTSGLENPLSHLLIVLLLIAVSRPSTRRVWWPLTVGSLALINRQDLAWLIGPCLAWHLWRQREARRWRALAIGIAPLALWEMASVAYYGFAVPNTAFAKLGTGIPEADLLRQGLWYLQESWTQDRLTLGAIGVSIAAGVLRRQTWPLAIGQALYLLYVVWIGGDFMSGRFLAAPLLVGAVVLASWPPPRARLWPWAIPATVILFGLAGPVAPYRSGPRFGEQRLFREFHGITDERRYYYPRTGLLRANHAWQVPDLTERAVTDTMLAAGQRVATRDAVGMFGYAAGPELHIVDTMALADPLLARLPSTAHWRIGHFNRELPDGYIQTLRTGENRIADPGLATYYDRLSLITRGPLLSPSRWRAIVRMNLGFDEALLAPYRAAR